MESAKLIEIVKLAQQGNQDSLQELYLDCYKSVYYLALKILRNPDDAEDVTQEVFIVVQQHITDLKEPAAFYKWLNQITNRRCMNYIRDHKPLSGSEEDEAAMMEKAEDDAFLLPDKAFDDAETRRIIMEVIDSLPIEQRFCIMAYYYEQITIAQISEDTGINENTIKSRLWMGRNKIRAALDEMEKKEGIKLYGIPMALTPILRQAFQEFQVPQGLGDAMWQNIAEATGIAAAGGGTAAVVSEAAKSGAQEAAITAGKEAAKQGIKAKVIGGVAGVVAVAGIVTAIMWPRQTPTPAQQSTPPVSQVLSSSSASLPQPQNDLVVFQDPVIEEAMLAAFIESNIDISDGVTTDSLKKVRNITIEYNGAGCTIDISTTTGGSITSFSDFSGLLDLADLAYCTGMELFYLDGDIQVDNINVLSDIRLTYFTIKNCPGVEILPDMMYPQYVTVGNTSISAIPEYAGATELAVYDCPIGNLSRLSECDNLIVLELRSLPTSDLSSIEDLTQLGSLTINDMPIDSIDALEKLTGLYTLIITDTQVSDISLLSAMTEMTALWLSNNEITDVSPLAGLSQLQWLYLDGNPISDRSVLNGLTNTEIHFE